MAKKQRNRSGIDRPISFADNIDSVYGIIRNPLGQGQFVVDCSDSIRRIAKVRGKDYKRVWIQPNDIVLLSLREGNNERADIEIKYMQKEINILKDNGYIEDSFTNANTENIKIDFDRI